MKAGYVSASWTTVWGVEDRYIREAFTGQRIHEGLKGEMAVSQPETGERTVVTQALDQAAYGGSRQGLVLHSTLMAVIGGSLTLTSSPGRQTCLKLEMPVAAWER